MPQFFAPIIAGLRFPGKSRGLGECGGVCGLELIRCDGVRWRGCIQARWGRESGERRSGTPALLGGWFSGGLRRTGECGECEPGVTGCDGVQRRGCVQVWRGGERVRGDALARLRSWERWFLADSGGLGNVGSVSRGGWVWWYAAERLYTGLVGPGEWGRQTGRAEQGGMAYSPCRASKKHPHQRVLSAVRLF